MFIGIAMAEINVSTHSFNVVYDINNMYIRNKNNDILMQSIEDEQLMYIPQHVVYEVFGPDRNTNSGSTSQNESIPEHENATVGADVDHAKRRTWTYEETCALIASVEVYKDPLHHVKKRKHVWGNISHHLLSQQIEYSAEVCKKKWLNLVKTYKNCKDRKGKSGRCPTHFLFFKQMDKILGSEPNISSPHSIDPSESEGIPMPPTPEGLIDAEDPGEVNVDENPSNETDKERGQDDTPKRTPKTKQKTNITKLREELKILHTKLNTKNDLEERKLSLLEQKLKLDERKIIALEKLPGIIPSNE